MGEDPFKAYGGAAHDTPAEDPFAAYGGSAHAAQKLTENGQEVPEGGFGVGHYLKAAIPSGSDLVHALGVSGEQLQQRGIDEANKSLLQHVGNALMTASGTGPILSTGASMAKEAWRAARHPFDPMAGTHAAAAMNPVAASVIDAMTQQGLGTKEANATGIVNAAMLAGGEVAPKVAGKVTEIAPNLSAKVGAVGKVVAQDAAAHIPLVGRVIRRPSFNDYLEAAQTKADPQLALFNKTAKLGSSPLMATADKPLSATPIQDALTAPQGDLMARLDAAIKSGDQGEIAKISQEAGLTRPSEVDASGHTAVQSPATQKLPTLEERAAAGDWVAKGQLAQFAKAKAAANPQLEDAKWNMNNPGPKLIGPGSDSAAMASATKINSPAQAQAALDQAAQNMFGKKYADLNLEQKMKTFSAGAKIQNQTQSGNPQTSNLLTNQRILANHPGRVGVTHKPTPMAPGEQPIDIEGALRQSLAQRGIGPDAVQPTIEDLLQETFRQLKMGKRPPFW